MEYPQFGNETIQFDGIPWNIVANLQALRFAKADWSRTFPQIGYCRFQQ